MARSIRTDHMTPADELRELLASSEKRLANLKGSGEGAVELLLDLDRIDELWPQLEAQGMDLRPEAGRWETIQAQLRKNGAQLLRELIAAGGFDAVRRKYHPEYGQPQLPEQPGQGVSWWWDMDAVVRQDRVQRLKRTGIAVGVVGIIALAVALIFRYAFPVDPAAQAAMRSQSAGEQKIMGSADFQGALADFQQALQSTPNDPDAWLRVGAVQQKLGDTQAAEASFAKAASLYDNENKLLLARAAIYIGFLMIDEAQVDLDKVLVSDPNNAVAHYYMGSVWESRGDAEKAIAELQKASDLASEGNQAELIALARYRMGMLMQAMQVRGPDTTTPTPSPTPGS
jgi:tetratricopeptide (TPR) repeat protein